MKNILVANSKGGSGKTTVATNLAGYLATQGHRVVLSDLDRQQSSALWVARRPAGAATIYSQQLRAKDYEEEPGWIVTDSPAGLREDKLSDAVKGADCIVVPIQPSGFDMGATLPFLQVLVAEKAVRKNKAFVGLVGMRVNLRTHSAASLAAFMAETGLPVITNLRNAQIYVQAAEQGLSLFDMKPSLVEQDLQQWLPLLNWVAEAAGVARQPGPDGN